MKRKLRCREDRTTKKGSDPFSPPWERARCPSPIEHLVAMKTGTGRGKDAIDIEELQKLQAQKT